MDAERESMKIFIIPAWRTIQHTSPASAAWDLIYSLGSLIALSFMALSMHTAAAQAQALNLAETPLFVSGSKTALVQLVVQRDNNLFYEAYPSYEDFNGDGVLDIRYKPDEIDYIGYFDSHFCYSMSEGDHLIASSRTRDKTCNGDWSGDILNYLTMTRMDIMLRALYGGKR